MKNRNTKDIFYYLSIEDIQTVAVEEIDRRLSNEEIENIKEKIASKVNWYEAIAQSIHENFKAEGS